MPISATTRKLLVYVALATAAHGLIALALTSRVFFYVSVGSSQRLFGGSIGPESLFEDVRAYHEYANRALGGEVPYRDYLIEYPIGALPLFLVPRLAAPRVDSYRWALLIELLALDGSAVGLVAWRVARTDGVARVPARLLWYTIALAALGPLPYARFDFAPMALSFASALAWSEGWPVVGGLAAALGMLVKIVPAAVLGPALASDLAQQRRSGLRGLLTFGAVSAVGVGAWIVLGGQGVINTLGYHAGRGLELQSLAAGLILIVARVAGTPIGTDFNHHSMELLSPWSATAARWALPLQVLAVLVATGRALRSDRGELVRYCGAAVLGMLVFGKVISPQSVLWPLPFVAVLGGTTGDRARWLYLGCALANTAVYPWAAMGLVLGAPTAIVLLNLRNALLLALLGILLFGPAVLGPGTIADQSLQS
jgi:hypothetical protein